MVRAQRAVVGVLTLGLVALVGTSCEPKASTPVEVVNVRPAATPLATPRQNSAAATPAQSGMVSIPGGTFQTGTPPRAARVNAFEFDLTEVTVAAFDAATGDCDEEGQHATMNRRIGCNGCRAEKRSHPINCVPWSVADAYCRKQGKRLPSGVEWEYAARGGSAQRRYPWSDAPPGAKLLNSCGQECEYSTESWDDGWPETAPVGTFPDGQSLHGVLDLAGNVWEWTSDQDGPIRPARGGAWDDRFNGTAAVYEAYSRARTTLGFRCAR
jgi:formylglycine-generating enzyme required for sulfatase activity